MKNRGQGSGNRDQGSGVVVRSIEELISKLFHKYRHGFVVFLLLLPVICPLLPVSCNLFNPPEDDYFTKIEDEIAWANARHLTVTVAMPTEWGSSPQAGTGRCFDNLRTNQTPRMGYDFTVQFNPSPVYGDARWRAYKTSDLSRENENWAISPASIAAVLNRLDDKGNLLYTPLSEEQVQFSPYNITTVTANISDALTIIPWTMPQPRIIASSPPLTALSESYPRSPNQDIRLTFAAPVDTTTLKFGTETIEVNGEEKEIVFITITGWSFNSKKPVEGFDTVEGTDMQEYFLPPHYDDQTNILTLQSKGNIPEGLAVEVRLGEGIKNTGEGWGLNEVAFSFQTGTTTMTIDSWQAVYDKAGSRIDVRWKLPENTGDLHPVARYRLNNEPFRIIALSSPYEHLSITDVSAINDGYVRDGIAVSGINWCTITLTLGDDITTIRILNVPGMKVQQNWKDKEGEPEPDIIVVEITDAQDMRAMRDKVNSDENDSERTVYSLLNNITLENWIPIGTAVERQQFKGHFYGNGYTITIGSFAKKLPAYMGLFGEVNKAVIRDLVVDYDNISVETKDVAHVGGIASNVKGAAEILNSIVRGNLTVTLKVDAEKYIGGIIGGMESSVAITNCLSALNLEGDVTGLNAANYGGIVGIVSSGSSHTGITGVTASGELRFTQERGYMYAGGVAGQTLGNTNNIDMEFSGSLAVIKTGTGADIARIGGIVGYAVRNFFSNLRVPGSISLPNDFTFNFTSLTGVRLGGIAGDSMGSDIRNSWVSGNISEAITGTGYIILGGIIGNLHSTKVTNCRYELGSLLSNGNGTLRLGGGFGDANNGSTITNCYSAAALLSGTRTSYAVYVGGLIGNMLISDLIKSYAQTEVRALSGSAIYAGGLIGNWEVSTGSLEISKSYATGNVSATGSSTSGFDITAGGLIGRINKTNNGTLTLSNSYALGNVSAEQRVLGTNPVHAGGLVGLATTNNNVNRHIIIRHTFARGTVSAKSAGTGTVYAGGLVGQFTTNAEDEESALHNNAALGSSVTAMGGAADDTYRRAGRIFGDSNTENDFNYALETMFVGTAAVYTNNPYPLFNDDASPDKTITGKDGDSRTFNEFSRSTNSAWVNPDLLNFVSQTGVWNTFNMGRGYPLLNNLEGQW